MFWVPLAAASAHIFEEFVWPGGFADWYRRYRPEIAQSVSTTFLVWINAALLFGCFAVGVDAKTPVGPAFFLAMCALLAGNGVFHIFATMKMRRYSPGVVTGTLLYIPMGIYAFWAMLTSGRVSIGTAIAAALIGASYHFVSVANHRRRQSLALQRLASPRR